MADSVPFRSPMKCSGGPKEAWACSGLERRNVDGPSGEPQCLHFHLPLTPSFLHVLIRSWSPVALPTAPSFGTTLKPQSPPASLLLGCRADAESHNVLLPGSSQGTSHRLWRESMAQRWEQDHGCALGESQVRMSSNSSLFLRQSPKLSQRDLPKPEATETPRGQPRSTPSWKNLDPRNLMPC